MINIILTIGSKVHEALASRAASPIGAAGRTDEGHFDLVSLTPEQ